MQLPCPLLQNYLPSKPMQHGMDRRASFYLDALTFAQGYWLAGKPAQAILQLNKAFSAYIAEDDPVLKKWQWPYAALEWIIDQSADGTAGFLGNPVRHFQHLASRLSGVRSDYRILRAWKCFHIAKRTLHGRGNFPMDGRQLAREGIFIPAEKWKSV